MVITGPYTDDEIREMEVAKAWLEEHDRQREEREQAELKRRENPIPYRMAELYRAFEEIDLDCLRFYQGDIGTLARVRETFHDDPKIQTMVKNLIDNETHKIKELIGDIENDREAIREFENLHRG